MVVPGIFERARNRYRQRVTINGVGLWCHCLLLYIEFLFSLMSFVTSHGSHSRRIGVVLRFVFSYTEVWGNHKRNTMFSCLFDNHRWGCTNTYLHIIIHLCGPCDHWPAFGYALFLFLTHVDILVIRATLHYLTACILYAGIVRIGHGLGGRSSYGGLLRFRIQQEWICIGWSAVCLMPMVHGLAQIGMSLWRPGTRLWELSPDGSGAYPATS